jgi:hypothetical protein
MITGKNRIYFIIFGAAMLLLVPFFAMQFTAEVNWSVFDFIIAGVLLIGTGLVCEFILRGFKKRPYRMVGIIVAIFICFLVWAELAVGIFGTPFAGN